MKYSLLAVLALGTTSAIYHRSNLQDIDAELDDLMEKYEDKDQGKLNKIDKVSKQTKNKGLDDPTQAQVTDMTFKILSGNDLAQSSQKADDDDFYGQTLDKYAATSKTGDKILKKDDAQEAAGEIFQAKRDMEAFQAMAEVKKLFDKQWKEHDVSQKGFIDFNEGYSLMEEIMRVE